MRVCTLPVYSQYFEPWLDKIIQRVGKKTAEVLLTPLPSHLKRMTQPRDQPGSIQKSCCIGKRLFLGGAGWLKVYTMAFESISSLIPKEVHSQGLFRDDLWAPERSYDRSQHK